MWNGLLARLFAGRVAGEKLEPLDSLEPLGPLGAVLGVGFLIAPSMRLVIWMPKQVKWHCKVS